MSSIMSATQAGQDRLVPARTDHASSVGENLTEVENKSAAFASKKLAKVGSMGAAFVGEQLTKVRDMLPWLLVLLLTGLLVM